MELRTQRPRSFTYLEARVGVNRQGRVLVECKWLQLLGLAWRWGTYVHIDPYPGDQGLPWQCFGNFWWPSDNLGEICTRNNDESGHPVQSVHQYLLSLLPSTCHAYIKQSDSDSWKEGYTQACKVVFGRKSRGSLEDPPPLLVSCRMDLTNGDLPKSGGPGISHWMKNVPGCGQRGTPVALTTLPSAPTRSNIWRSNCHVVWPPSCLFYFTHLTSEWLSDLLYLISNWKKCNHQQGNGLVKVSIIGQLQTKFYHLEASLWYPLPHIHLDWSLATTDQWPEMMVPASPRQCSFST